MTGRWWIGMIAIAALGGCAHVAGSPGSSAEVAPPNVEQLLAVAGLAEKLGDGLRAQQYLHGALAAGADPERVWPRLLRLYIGDGQYRLAIETARDRLRSHPQQCQLRLLLADLYAATEEDSSAIAEYEEVLSASPNEARAHYALASLLHDKGRDRARADEHYQAYLALQPHGDHADEARALLLKELP
jgi:tetratricopeptide (TPR) repeat protein